MRTRTILDTLAAGVLLAAALGGPGSVVRARADAPGDPGASRIEAMRDLSRPATPTGPPTLNHFVLLGSNDLGTFRDYGDVFGHGDAAYVGTRCGVRGTGGEGAAVVDISDPTHPRVASRLSNPIYSRAEDLTVRTVRTPAFNGDLALVGIQLCFEAPGVPDTGFELFDVTNINRPRRLSFWKLERGAVGCHEVDLVQRADGRVLAGCARNLYDALSGTPQVEIVDVTRPTSPRLLSTWTTGISPNSGIGCIPFSWAHSVRFADGGMTAYASNWDAGTFRLDLTNPASPVKVGVTHIVDEDLDQHSVTPANGGAWEVINPEDFSPIDCEDGTAWGEAHVYDQTDPGAPGLVGTFATSNASSLRNDGIYTIHNTEVTHGTTFLSSWYSDGIVWWSMDASGNTRQFGQFVPPATQAAPPLVWGVYLDTARDLVLASDMTTGLYVLRPVGLDL